jgi:hypothetical protein
LEIYKFKDRFLLGALSGMVGGIVPDFINQIEYERGLTDATYRKMAKNLFLKRTAPPRKRGD